MKWLAVIAFPLLLGVAAALYFVGFDAVARRLKFDASSPWVPIVAVGSLLLALYLIAK